jgi:hypothetical protein
MNQTQKSTACVEAKARTTRTTICTRRAAGEKYLGSTVSTNGGNKVLCYVENAYDNA